MQTARYRIDRGNLEGLDPSGAVLWSRRPMGWSAKSISAIPHSSDCIVLCDPDDEPRGAYRNLLRVSSDGLVVWQADLPSSENDCYVAVQLRDDILSANTFSCFAVRLDLVTGRILTKTFTK